MDHVQLLCSPNKVESILVMLYVDSREWCLWLRWSPSPDAGHVRSAPAGATPPKAPQLCQSVKAKSLEFRDALKVATSLDGLRGRRTGKQEAKCSLVSNGLTGHHPQGHWFFMQSHLQDSWGASAMYLKPPYQPPGQKPKKTLLSEENLQRLSDLIGPYKGTYRIVYGVLQAGRPHKPCLLVHSTSSSDLVPGAPRLGTRRAPGRARREAAPRAATRALAPGGAGPESG